MSTTLLLTPEPLMYPLPEERGYTKTFIHIHLTQNPLFLELSSVCACVCGHVHVCVWCVCVGICMCVCGVCVWACACVCVVCVCGYVHACVCACVCVLSHGALVSSCVPYWAQGSLSPFSG